MSLCASCRSALRRTLRSAHHHHHHQRAALSTKTTSPSTPTTATPPPNSNNTTATTSTAQNILSKPTWSIRSLLSSTDGAPPVEPITPTQLRHLLRLAALPQPRSADEEQSMISTLRSQLQFVRAIQRVDTAGVEPLRAVRDETHEGVAEGTVGLDALRGVLDQESLVGHYKRPRRAVKGTGAGRSEAERWDVLGTASRKAGKYFVVQNSKKGGENAS